MNTTGDSFVFCENYLPANHVYFQVGNFLLFISYMAPSGLGGLLYLRATLAGGMFFLALWGYVVLCALDTFLWCFVCMCINLAHFVYILWQQRPIKLEAKHEQLYRAVFQRMHVSRGQMAWLLQCSRQLQHVPYLRQTAEEGVSRLDTISLVLEGQFLVTQKSTPLHLVEAHEFIESPEWFLVGTSDLSPVTVTALADSCLLVWHRDKLRLQLTKDPFLQCVFDKLLGRDVVKKLLQVDEKMHALRHYAPAQHTDACVQDKQLLSSSVHALQTGPAHISSNGRNREMSDRLELKANGVASYRPLETLEECSTRQCTRM